MQIFNEIAPLQAVLEAFHRTGKTIGLVPTMGALHEGHLALVKASKSHNSVTVCTIYVNPTQFNNPVDLQKYPRNIDKDVEILEKVDCDIVFCPTNEEMYGQTSLVKFDFGPLEMLMEGRFRPGHFSGVALVVSKFFNIVNPANAYFGQKDWQQFAILQQVVLELKFNLKLHCIPTLRETDGLAMSSRNLRLDASQRQWATIFYQTLLEARENLNNGKDIPFTKERAQQRFKAVNDARLEYFEVVDSKNLNVLDFVKEAETPILCIAGYIGEIRLIDNMFLK